MKKGEVALQTIPIKRADAHEAYRRAGDILALDGQRLRLIEASVVCIVMVSAYVILYRAVFLMGSVMPASKAQDLITFGIYAVLSCVLTLFVTLPLTLGLWRLAGKAAFKSHLAPIGLFYYFSSAILYRRALRLSFGAFWRMLCVVLAVAATCGTTVHFFAGELLAGLLCGVAVLLEVVLWSLLCLRRFAVFAIAFNEDVPLKAVRRRADLMQRADRFCGVRFVLTFLPRVLLGLLTFGLYLLWDVLPRMGVAYFIYCNQINDMIIQSEESRI